MTIQLSPYSAFSSVHASRSSDIPNPGYDMRISSIASSNIEKSFTSLLSVLDMPSPHQPSSSLSPSPRPTHSFETTSRFLPPFISPDRTPPALRMQNPLQPSLPPIHQRSSSSFHPTLKFSQHTFPTIIHLERIEKKISSSVLFQHYANPTTSKKIYCIENRRKPHQAVFQMILWENLPQDIMSEISSETNPFSYYYIPRLSWTPLKNMEHLAKELKEKHVFFEENIQTHLFANQYHSKEIYHQSTIQNLKHIAEKTRKIILETSQGIILIDEINPLTNQITFRSPLAPIRLTYPIQFLIEKLIPDLGTECAITYILQNQL